MLGSPGGRRRLLGSCQFGEGGTGGHPRGWAHLHSRLPGSAPQMPTPPPLAPRLGCGYWALTAAQTGEQLGLETPAE